MSDTDVQIATIQKNARETIRIALRTYKGHRSVDVHKGDVILERDGDHIGHVGFATGELRRDINGNVVGVGMISGNYGHTVRENWERPDQIGGIRRQMNLPEAARNAGAKEHKITHDGGADLNVRIRSDGSVSKVQTQSRGLIRSVKLRSSWPQMARPSDSSD